MNARNLCIFNSDGVFGNDRYRVALSVEPLEVEQWLKSLKGQEGLANPTLDRTRRVYVARLQARPTSRTDSTKSGVEPDALRPLQDHQRVRSDDSHA